MGAGRHRQTGVLPAQPPPEARQQAHRERAALRALAPQNLGQPVERAQVDLAGAKKR